MRCLPLLFYCTLLAALIPSTLLSPIQPALRHDDLSHTSLLSGSSHTADSATGYKFPRTPIEEPSLRSRETEVVSSRIRNAENSVKASTTAPTTPTSVPLPLRPRITPAVAVAGVLLICLGVAYALIGVKIRWILVPVGIFFLIDIAVAVLLAYVASPPISDGIQGAYFGAILGSGVVLGTASWFFKEITEGLICLLGGYCLSMWILILRSGSSIHDSGSRAIFIVVISIAAYALWFSRYTRDYGLIACSSFAGATAFSMGIDCFSKAGMKEFWLYIWALNDKIFPFGTHTYPLTKGLRIEIAVIILGAVAGAMSQMRLWLLLQERQKHGRRGSSMFAKEPSSQTKQIKPQRFASWRVLLGSRRRRRSERFPLDDEEPFNLGLPPGINDSHLSRSVAEELEMRFFSAFTLPPVGESIRGVISPKQPRVTIVDEENITHQPQLSPQEHIEEVPTSLPPPSTNQNSSLLRSVDNQAEETAMARPSKAAVKRKPLPTGVSRTVSSPSLPLSSPPSEYPNGQDSQSVYVTPESDREGFVEPLLSNEAEECNSRAPTHLDSQDIGENHIILEEGRSPNGTSDGNEQQASRPIERKRSRIASSRNHLLRESKGRRSKDAENFSLEHFTRDDAQRSLTEVTDPCNEEEAISLSTSDTQNNETESLLLLQNNTPGSRNRSIAASSDLMRTSIDENSETDFESLNGSQSNVSARLSRPPSQVPNNKGRKRRTLSTLEEGSVSASERLRRLRESSSSHHSSNDSASSYARRPKSIETQNLRSISEAGSCNPSSNATGENPFPWRRSSMETQSHHQPGLIHPAEAGPVISRQHGRRSFTDPERRAEMMANWRESVRQEIAVSNAPYETADSRRVEMLMHKHQDRLSQLQREAAAIRREQAYDQAMRSREMQTAHREAMQKLQATANTRT